MEADWRALAARDPEATVFQSWEWSSAWWRAFRAGRQLLVLTAWAGPQLAGVLPLTLRRLGPVRLAELLGAGRTDYLAPLLDPTHPGVLTVLLAALRERAAEWDVLWLRDLPLDEPGEEQLRAAIRTAGLGGAPRHWDVSPYLDLAGGWDAYLAGRSSNFRSDLKRKRRRLEELGPVSIERHREPDAVRGALREAAQIERHSWKAFAGTARLASPHGYAFMEDAAGGLAEAGRADLWLLRCGEKPVAFYLDLVSGESVCYYSGTYRDGFESGSPGKVLMAEVIRAACEEGFRRFDFLRGAESYKATWTDQSRPLTEAFLHSRRPRSRIAARLLGDLALPAKRSPRGRALVDRWQRLRAGSDKSDRSDRSDGSDGCDGCERRMTNDD